MTATPWEQMSDAEISMEITRANARIDAAEHTRRSLLRELERRTNHTDGSQA